MMETGGWKSKIEERKIKKLEGWTRSGECRMTSESWRMTNENWSLSKNETNGFWMWKKRGIWKGASCKNTVANAAVSFYGFVPFRCTRFVTFFCRRFGFLPFCLPFRFSSSLRSGGQILVVHLDVRPEPHNLALHLQVCQGEWSKEKEGAR